MGAAIRIRWRASIYRRPDNQPSHPARSSSSRLVRLHSSSIHSTNSALRSLSTSGRFIRARGVTSAQPTIGSVSGGSSVFRCICARNRVASASYPRWSEHLPNSHASDILATRDMKVPCTACGAMIPFAPLELATSWDPNPGRRSFLALPWATSLMAVGPRLQCVSISRRSQISLILAKTADRNRRLRIKFVPIAPWPPPKASSMLRNCRARRRGFSLPRT
jgi:hypothetical protein